MSAEQEWRRYRRAVRRAFTMHQWDRVIDLVDAFDDYCTSQGWPDWWSEMNVKRSDALILRDRERQAEGYR